MTIRWPVLAFDLCFPGVRAVAFSEDGRCEARTLPAASRSSRDFGPLVDELLDSPIFDDGPLARRTPGSVVVTRGPGSFTGIRIGLAAALGLARATGAERIERTVFDLVLRSGGASGGVGARLILVPGHREEVYWCETRAAGSAEDDWECVDAGCSPLSSLIPRLSTFPLVLFADAGDLAARLDAFEFDRSGLVSVGALSPSRAMFERLPIRFPGARSSGALYLRDSAARVKRAAAA